MAVTGVFNADFSSFYDAVDKSTAKLKDIESGASKVETSLNRMANSFSGQKVIQDATLMAKVFEDAGGAAAFTEKELARMGATANEAVAKLTALGKDIPAGIQQIADASKAASTQTESWSGSLKTLIVGYVSMQTVMAGWNFVKDVVAAAGALEDLSAQTRIGVEDLQVMGQAMSDFGVSTDDLGHALFKLSNNIALGDASTVHALKILGLSLREVQNLHGEELFRVIQEAAANTNTALGDTALVTLYGEKLAQSMRGAAAGTRDALDAAREHADFMKAEDTKAMDAASEKVDRLKLKLEAMASTIIGPVAQGFMDHIAVMEKAGGGAVNLAIAQDKLLGLVGKEQHAFEDLAMSVGVETTAKRNEREATEAASTAGTTHIGMVTAQEEAYKKLTASLYAERDARAAEVEKRDREAAAGLKEFQRLTDEAAAMSDINKRAATQRNADAEHQRTNAANALQDQLALNTATEGGAQLVTTAAHANAGYTQSLQEVNRINAAAIDFEKNRAEEQKRLDEENKQLIESTNALGKAHTDAGTAADAATKQTVAGYAAVQQQIVFTGDAIKEWQNLQRYSAAANAILGEGGLFTTQSQRDRLAGLPSFASGVENFSGGVAKVHEGELLVNLPGGTSVIPKGQGGNVTMSNTFNLVDSESNLARRVSELIMRSVRAGTQLGTT